MYRSLRVVVAASAFVLAWGALAAPKDSVTIGMVLEPPGLDPTTGAAAAIGEIVHYNIFEGLTKINGDFSVTPLLAESWSLSPDAKTLTFKLRFAPVPEYPFSVVFTCTKKVASVQDGSMQ